MRKVSAPLSIAALTLIGSLTSWHSTVSADPPGGADKAPQAAGPKEPKTAARRKPAKAAAQPKAAATPTARFGTPQCDACLQKSCNPMHGVAQLLAGCADATCEQTFACFQRNHCAVDTVTMPRCYCGNVSLEACRAASFDAKGPCADLVEAGLETKVSSEVIDRLVGTDTSTGDGAALFQCAAEFCTAECLTDRAIPKP